MYRSDLGMVFGSFYWVESGRMASYGKILLSVRGYFNDRCPYEVSTTLQVELRVRLTPTLKMPYSCLL